MSENTPVKRDELGRIVAGSAPLNPNGQRGRRTEEVLAAEEALWESTPKAVKRLLELIASTDEKIALGAVTAHLKTTIGVLERKGNSDGSPLDSALNGATLDQLLEIIRRRK